MSYPHKLIPSNLLPTIFSAALASLTLQGNEPVVAVLHFLRDLLGYGGENPPSSISRSNPPEIQQTIKNLLVVGTTDGKAVLGAMLVQRLMTGILFTFPRDCYHDGTGLLQEVIDLLPQQTTQWIEETISLLPAGSLPEKEKDRFLTRLQQAVAASGDRGDLRGKARPVLQDFASSFRRRNVNPREGLGRLEASRFHFTG